MLGGRKILVLEDDAFVALDVAMSLKDAGARVVGPFARAEVALEQIADIGRRGVDAAVLDVDLGDHLSEDVAKELSRLGIPFLFYTGADLEQHKFVKRFDASVLPKPLGNDDLIAATHRCLESRE